MVQIDLPEVIPLFPLPGALLLPRGRLPLHVFEPRYLAMLDDVLKTRERLIGIIQPRPAPEGQRRLSAIGCAGRLTSFTETDDGRYMIALSGISRFRLEREVGGFTPYLRAAISGMSSHAIAAMPSRTTFSTATVFSTSCAATLPRGSFRPTGRG